MEAILLTLFGVLVGVLVTSIYSRQSLKDLREVESNLKNELAVIVGEFEKLSRKISPTQPETAREMSEIIHKFYQGSSAEPSVMSENDACPECAKQTIKFTNYGVGPLGVNNAWYACTSCGYKFQSGESSED